MRVAVLLLTILLTGCKTVPEVVDVRVAIPVACQIAEPERPLMPTDELDPAAPVDVQARYLRAEIEIREGYEDRLLTALRGCRKPITP